MPKETERSSSLATELCLAVPHRFDGYSFKGISHFCIILVSVWIRGFLKVGNPQQWMVYYYT